MGLDSGKEQLRKAFPVGATKKENKEWDQISATPRGITLSKKEKTPMATLTIRYPLELEKRLEKIAHFAGLNKTEVVSDIFLQIFPDLESQYGIKNGAKKVE